MTLAIAFAAGFALGFVASIPPAGPVSLLVLQRGILKRFREGIGVALGGAIAEALYAGLAVFGMASLFERVSILGWGSRILGALVLLALGFYFLRFRVRSAPGDLAPPTGRSAVRSFAFGFGIAISNLTLILTWSTFVAVVYSIGAPRFGISGNLLFAAGVGAGIFGWLLVLLWALRRYGRHVTDLLAARMVRIAGVLLLGLGVFAAVSVPLNLG